MKIFTTKGTKNTKDMEGVPSRWCWKQPILKTFVIFVSFVVNFS